MKESCQHTFHRAPKSQVQSDLNKLSAEATVEHSSILVDNCDDSDIVCTGSLPAKIKI